MIKSNGFLLFKIGFSFFFGFFRFCLFNVEFSIFELQIFDNSFKELTTELF